MFRSSTLIQLLYSILKRLPMLLERLRVRWNDNLRKRHFRKYYSTDRFSMIIEILSNLYSLTLPLTETETGAELHKRCFTCLWKSSLKSSSVIGGFALRRLWNENAFETQNEKQVKRRFFLLFLFLFIIIVVHKLHLNCLLTRAMLSRRTRLNNFTKQTLKKYSYQS